MTLGQLLTAAACERSGPDGNGTPDATPLDCEFDGPPAVEIGGGLMTTGFVVIEDGDDMMLELGPAGQPMLTPSLCVHNMWPGLPFRIDHNPEDPEIVFQLYRASDDTWIGGSAREHFGLTRTSTCLERLQIFVVIADYVDGEPVNHTALVGHALRLHVTVTDACEQTAEDDLTVMLRYE